MVNIMQSVVENLKQIGIRASIQETDYNAWAAQYFRHENLGMQITPSYADFRDPADLPSLFFSSATAVKDGMNASNLRNCEVDAFLKTANEQADPKARAEALKGVFKIANEYLAVVPDHLACLGDGDQQQVQAHRLQRLLVQCPVGDQGFSA